MARAGLDKAIGEEHFFNSTHEAVEFMASYMQSQSLISTNIKSDEKKIREKKRIAKEKQEDEEAGGLVGTEAEEEQVTDDQEDLTRELEIDSEEEDDALGWYIKA
jgi:hypothetical protein